MEARDQQEAPAETAPVDDDAPISADPVTEIRTLRAKNRILRAERTAIAGRKYVLETVVESLRQKLDELARAFATVEAGGDIAEAIKTVGALVGDARRIAEDKEALEGELEAERVERLQERRSREAREFELEERAAGLAAERSVLLERIAALEAKASEVQSAGTSVEDLKRQLATATAELATAATELERAANDAETRAKELEEARTAHEEASREVDGLNAELAALKGTSEAATRAHAQHAHELEKLQKEVDHARGERDGLNRQLIAAQAEHSRALEQAVAQGSKNSDSTKKLEIELATAKGQLTEQAPVLDALADKVDELEKEVTKLATRLGEARERGKVDVKELLVRAAVLKRREAREAEERARAAEAPISRAAKSTGPVPKPTGSYGKPPAGNAPPAAGQVPPKKSTTSFSKKPV